MYAGKEGFRGRTNLSQADVMDDLELSFQWMRRLEAELKNRAASMASHLNKQLPVHELSSLEAQG